MVRGRIAKCLAAGLGAMVLTGLSGPGSAAPAFDAKDLSGIWMQNGGGKFGDYPWTPEYGAIAAKRKAASDAGNPYQPAGASCLPRGLVGMLTTGAYPIEILQRPKEVVLIKENGGTHRIHIGRKHQAADDLSPLFYGDSVAEWQGDTLVVDSVSLGATDNIDGQNPHSDVMHVVQKYRRTAPDKLEVELTVDDSKAFTRPITTKSTFARLPDYEMQEYYCVNERNVFTEGGQAVALPGQR